ncbi:MAG: DUF177 domain-containing protein [Ilumatobacteraceae bacterium]
MASPFIVNTVELLRRLGAQRDITLSVPASQFGFHDVRLADDSPIDVNLHLESLTNGIVVHGEISGLWQLQCRRCLRAISEVSIADVDELYQRIPDNPDAYPLEGDQLDLRPMIRELVLLSEPVSPLCRPDCPGMCPNCGADLQTDQCDCATGLIDERWAVLDQLRKQMGE